MAKRMSEEQPLTLLQALLASDVVADVLCALSLCPMSFCALQRVNRGFHAALGARPAAVLRLERRCNPCGTSGPWHECKQPLFPSRLPLVVVQEASDGRGFSRQFELTGGEFLAWYEAGSLRIHLAQPIAAKWIGLCHLASEFVLRENGLFYELLFYTIGLQRATGVICASIEWGAPVTR